MESEFPPAAMGILYCFVSIPAGAILGGIIGAFIPAESDSFDIGKLKENKNKKLKGKHNSFHIKQI